MSDISYNHKSYRNLEHLFFLDNGYILFNNVIEENNIETTDQLKKILIESMKINLISYVDALDTLNHDELKKIMNQKLNHNYALLIFRVYDDCKITIKICQHNILNHYQHELLNINKDDNLLFENKYVNLLDNLYTYTINAKKNDIIYLTPLTIFNATISNYNVLDIFGFKNKYTNELNGKIWKPFDLIESMENFFPLTDLKMHQFFVDYPNLYEELLDFERMGNGLVPSITDDHIIIRIKPYNNNAIIKMGIKPSLFESSIDVVYYYNMENRLKHTNYSEYDKFEIRTAGVLTKACNEFLSYELTNLMIDDKNSLDNGIIQYNNDINDDDDNDDSDDSDDNNENINGDINDDNDYDDNDDSDNGDDNDDNNDKDNDEKVNDRIKNFEFNLKKLINYFKNVDYNKIICNWFPKVNEFEIQMANTKDNILFNSIKKYNMFVFRHGFINEDSWRNDLVEDWAKELNLACYIILSNKETCDALRTINCFDKRYYCGYIILVGNDLYASYMHMNKRVNVTIFEIFENRYMCIHWKKSNIFDSSNCKYIADYDYNKLPYLEYTPKLKIKINDVYENEKYREIKNIINNLP